MNIRKLNWQIDFRKTILLSCTILIISIVVVLFWLPARRYSKLYRLQAENYNQNIISQTNLGIVQSLQQFESKIKEVIDNPEIRNSLSSSLPVSEFQYEYQKIIEGYFDFQSLDAYYLECLDIYPLNRTGSFQYGYKNTQIKNIKNSSFYESALIHPTTLNWLPYNTHEQCLELARCIYDYDTYELQGILIIRLSHDFLLDKFQNLNVMDTDCLYILDSDGQILCSTDPTLPGTVYKEYHFLSSSGTYSNDGRLYSYARLKSAASAIPYDNWITIMSLNENTLFASFRKILHDFNVIAVLILLASAIAVFFLARKLITPIYALTNAMEQVSKENLSVSLPTVSFFKEYTTINQGFNHMVLRLDMLINTVYKAQLAQKEAQLKTLQSQINPHFLFNTLQLISWKAYEYEAVPVCDMIASLSYMLQTDLYSDDENCFTLRQELEYIRQYSLIIKNKYDNRISITTNVPEELLDCRIPKLILQPFLENSIKHGLEPKISPGNVSLSISRSRNNLICVISDNGIGMRNDTLKKIQSANLDMPSEKVRDEKGHQIALSNIQRRIKLLYGDEYGFSVISQPYQGTIVTLIIPCNKEETFHD